MVHTGSINFIGLFVDLGQPRWQLSRPGQILVLVQGLNDQIITTVRDLSEFSKGELLCSFEDGLSDSLVSWGSDIIK